MKPRYIAILLLIAALFFIATLGHAAESSAVSPRKDACCEAMGGTSPTALAKDLCCAAEAGSEIQTPKSKIKNFSANSLYQLDATFTDDSGKPFALGSLRGRPVVMNMFFASCGYACPLTVTDMQAIQGRVPAEQRDQAVFVLVSFDTERDTPEALARYRAQRGLDNRWILLRGEGDAVRELAALLGVKFKQEADGSFSHSNLVTILNREGEIVHQRTGLKGGLDEAAAALTTVARAN